MENDGHPDLESRNADAVRRGYFTELLSNPFISWVSGDIEVNDPSGTQFHDKEKIDRAEKQLNDRKEITSPNVLSMVLEKNRLGLGWRMVGSDLVQILIDRGRGDLYVQFEEFATPSASVLLPITRCPLPSPELGRLFPRLTSDDHRGYAI